MVPIVQFTIRIASMAAMLLIAGAIGLGKLSPGPEGRSIAPGLLVGVAPRVSGPPAGELNLLDTRTGAIQSLSMDRTDRVDLAISSPWVDGWDRAHVVGRWTAIGPDGILRETGLARVAYPSGEVLDRVPLERYPVTTPCWGAGTTSRVLFASGDGSLYRFDFEPAAGDPGFEGQPGLSRVRWGVDSPGVENPVILDVSRPEGCLPPDMVLATVVPRVVQDDRGRVERSRIWWLRLNADEDEIVACGPVAPDDPEGRDVGRRRPTLGRRADGSLWLAYLSWNGVPDRMALRIAPARFDHVTNAPSTSGPGIPLAEGCLGTPLSFSGGGTRLTYFTFEANRPTPSQISLDDTPSPTALAVVAIPAGS